MRFRLTAMFLVFSVIGTGSVAMDTSAGKANVQTMATGLDEPWSIGFLPDGYFLITERDGNLLLAKDGALTRVSGLPRVRPNGQGGLLDVLVPRDFARTKEIFLTYAGRERGRPVTKLARADLSIAQARLTGVRDLFTMQSPSGGGRHFGSRIVEAPSGHLFITLGDRGDQNEAQNLSTHNGSVIRLRRDGTIPRDNPFVGTPNAQPEIWSFGHRNPQGAALDLQGNLWLNEHGAKGGDEVNRVRAGANYGWPVISYGTAYSGRKIGEGTSKPGMEQPEHYWDPSIAPSGMMIYSGKLWPEWKGDIFIGSLKFDYIARLDPQNGWTEEALKSDETLRVRDIREAPDGSIWFLSVGNGAAYRLRP